MEKAILIIIIIFLLAFLSIFSFRITEYFIKKDFSTETKAVCMEIKENNCYYKCWDEVFLNSDGKSVSIQKLDGYVCYDKTWVDPRIT